MFITGEVLPDLFTNTLRCCGGWKPFLCNTEQSKSLVTKKKKKDYYQNKTGRTSYTVFWFFSCSKSKGKELRYSSLCTSSKKRTQSRKGKDSHCQGYSKKHLLEMQLEAVAKKYCLSRWTEQKGASFSILGADCCSEQHLAGREPSFSVKSLESYRKILKDTIITQPWVDHCLVHWASCSSIPWTTYHLVLPVGVSSCLSWHHRVSTFWRGALSSWSPRSVRTVALLRGGKPGLAAARRKHCPALQGGGGLLLSWCQGSGPAAVLLGAQRSVWAACELWSLLQKRNGQAKRNGGCLHFPLNKSKAVKLQTFKEEVLSAVWGSLFSLRSLQ